MNVEAQAIEEENVAPTKSLFGHSATSVVIDEVAETEEVSMGDSEPVEQVEDAHTEPFIEIDDAEQSIEEIQAQHEAEDAEEAIEPKPVEEAAEEDSLEAMQAKKEELTAKIEDKQKAERKAVIDQIAVVVKTYAIPINELVTALGGLPNPRKGLKAPITHKDGHGNTWSGRGKLPKWLKDKNPDDYKV